jgi:SsrA-binding protein
MSEIKNRSAYYDYFIEDKYDAGMVLVGTEVKSIRDGKVNFVDSFCVFFKGELWVRNMHIAEYRFGTTNNHIAVHDRKLLLTKRELRKLENKMKEKGRQTRDRARKRQKTVRQTRKHQAARHPKGD